MTTIIMVTNNYPSEGSSEKPFVLGELEAMVDAGHSVTLLPLFYRGVRDAECPRDVKVCSALSMRMRPPMLVWLAAVTVFKPYFWREFFKNFRLIASSVMRAKTFLRQSIKVTATYSALKAMQADARLYYSYWCAGEAYGALLYRSHAATHTSVLARAHGYDLYKERSDNAGYLAYQDTMIGALDRLVLLSNQAKTYVRNSFPGGQVSIDIASLGVASQRDVTTAHFDNKRVTLASCAYPVSVKRLSKIFQTACAYARLSPDCEVAWHHFGANAADIGIDANELSSRPKNLECVFHGKVEVAEIIARYKQMVTPVFMNLSSTEGQPVSVMEAMSCAFPVVATKVGGVSEMIDASCGALVDVNDTPESIATVISGWTSEANLYRKKSDNALTRQRQKFDQQKNFYAFAQTL